MQINDKNIFGFDVIVSNLAETFNGYILQARAKPIIEMMEDIRMSIMARIFNKRNLMKGAMDDICPRIRKKLEVEKDYAKDCFPIPASNKEFQVMHFTDLLIVNLERKTCSCKKWEITGVPCCHVIACTNWLIGSHVKIMFLIGLRGRSIY